MTIILARLTFLIFCFFKSVTTSGTNLVQNMISYKNKLNYLNICN